MVEHIDYVLLLDSKECILYFCFSQIALEVCLYLPTRSQHISFKFWEEVLYWSILGNVWWEEKYNIKLIIHLFNCRLKFMNDSLSTINTNLRPISYLLDLMSLNISLNEFNHLVWIYCRVIQMIKNSASWGYAWNNWNWWLKYDWF